MTTRQTYHPLHIALHWLMALMIPTLFGVGLWMTGLDYYSSWYKTAPDLHKSFGLLLALLLVLRLIVIAWRGKPAALPGHKVQQAAAHAAHMLMYLLLVGIVVSGYLISTADGRGIPVFNLFEVPSLGALFTDQADIAGDIHLYLAWTLVLLAAVHALAALKHHFIDKDNTLKRMLGRD